MRQIAFPMVAALLPVMSEIVLVLCWWLCTSAILTVGLKLRRFQVGREEEQAVKERNIRIPVCAPSINRLDVEAVSKCVQSTWISGTSEIVFEFERRFANYCGCKYGVATNSGTTALHVVLAALGIRPGDEVIVPAFTMIAAPNSVKYTGAKVVICDSESETWNLDPDQLSTLVTSSTKAIMPVHIYGHPANMDPILDFAEDHSLYVIEDAAEAHGAEYKGRRTGSVGRAGCFSFYANKIITTGEGGMVVTDDEGLAEKCRWLRAHAFGREGKHFYHEQLGFGYRMSGLQAALGLSQLERIDKFITVRRSHAKFYNSNLSELEDNITLPPEAKWAKNVYWLYSILLKDSFGMTRQDFMNELVRRGVETRTFFYPVNVQPVFSQEFVKRSFPVADMLSKEGVNLPSGSNLTNADVSHICNCIREIRKMS